MHRRTYSPALMDDDSLPGAFSGLPPRPISPATFDQAYGATAHSELVWRLAAQAYGEDYPSEVQPWGMTTFWVLGRCVSGLRVGPGHLLVDLACGRGGPGLWLARATGADLIGIDWSPVGVETASARASNFVPADRARFMVGDLAASGLPDGSADAVVCLDSIFFAADRIAALREVHRLLRPAGRYVFTAPEVQTPTQPFHVPDWAPLLEAAGLQLENKEVVPHQAEQLGRMYQLWLEHLDAIRAEVGGAAATRLEAEARGVGPILKNRKPLLIVARRPG
ncbi:MAG: class I SAM-dependent methyltransferase [Chloroflexi bacterium]|nr:MAG: class I SAM-dependent methyltransferase [Chloroflexota bacterium]